jgi:cytoskeleton protein RodZ
VVDTEAQDQALFPERAGEMLRAARMRSGLDLGDVATRTRIPLRRLESIERGDHSDMPSPTYVIGFAKSFARAVGADPEVVADALRDELGQQRPSAREMVDLDDFDPQRLPSRKLAWTAALIALLILGGYGLWRGWLMRDPAPETPEVAETVAPRSEPVANASVAAAPSPTGQVVLTARDAVWMRVYDAADKVLFEKEMAAGERFEVPANANTPMIRTGRADLIAVTIDGREVATLGPAERTVKDVGISATALAARPPAPASTPDQIPGNATATP